VATDAAILEALCARSPARVLDVAWYFRTLDSWRRSLALAGFERVRDEHIHHPASGVPLALILCAARCR
jgi:hypothetical protein